MRVGEGLKIFGAMKIMFNPRSVSLGVKRKFFERLQVSPIMYGVETWGVRMDEKHKTVIMEMKC